ncbi:sterol desaturase family protein [Yoonia sp.]|uniref:sterol desaturase family protein n=1 Tax=Yoonia sp. TaxID=2212373 RepID=UPI0025DC3ACB|nr:sterol desaturase family protein [Yoonia sp.]
MPHFTQSPERDAREQDRQRKYRKQFVADTPSWYHGLYHLGFTLVLTLGALAYSISQLNNPAPWEWALIPIFALVGNLAEYSAHRWIMHRPVPGLKMVYKRHCTTHHQFFTHHDLGYKGHKEWRALLFPPLAPVAFVLLSIPPALLANWLVSSNAAYLIVISMSGYYLFYEFVHTLSHLDDEKSPYLRHVPLINTIRRMHYIHHVLGLMQTKNFNLTFPIGDWIFGTSDLDRGFWGTMFNGDSDEHQKKGLQYEDLDVLLPGVDISAARTDPQPAAALPE